MKNHFLIAVVTVSLVYGNSWAERPAGASASDAGSQNEKTRASLDRIGAESKTAQDANLAAKGDSAALDRLRRSAEVGDAYADFRLGMLYRDGTGVPKDDAEFIVLLRRSADLGYVDAQVRLIEVYEKGEGAPKDEVQAAGWARKAAEQGDAVGIGELMLDYYKGRGVGRDYVQAVKWYTIGLKLGVTGSSTEFFEALKRRAGRCPVPC